VAAQREALSDKIAIDMTPMIDVVFQLITFFMLTLKTVITEGDFDIKMPLGASAGAALDDPLPPVRVRMTAGPGGERTSLSMNGQAVGDFDELRTRIVDLVGTPLALSPSRYRRGWNLPCTALRRLASTCVYRCVVAMLAWPSISCT